VFRIYDEQVNADFITRQAFRSFELPPQSTFHGGRSSQRSVQGKLLKPVIAAIRHCDGLLVPGYRDVKRGIELVGIGTRAAVFVPDKTAEAKGRVGLKRIQRRLKFPDLIVAGYR